MQRYELVFLLDASLNDSKREEVVSKIEKALGS